jgi:putative transposase
VIQTALKTAVHKALTLAAHRGAADAAGIDWKSAVFRKVKEEVMADRGLTIERMVRLARLSRASYYRFEEGAESGSAPEMKLRDAIQRIALEWPSYGRRRITRELRRRGWRVNPKRVQRLMREDNLLCVRKRKFVVTTDSNHGKKTYPNLARKMVLTDMDQLWVADITYIRLREEFVFLAVILDAYSRRVIGWALDRTIEDDLTLRALRMALAQRVIGPGLVHHSDRGSQYASNDYTDLLKENDIEISMSRKGNPWDNAACESFMKTLKYEEVHRNEYRDLNEARSTIRIFLEKIYNHKRLHSAIGYVPPAEFEASLLTQQKEAATRQLAG